MDGKILYWKNPEKNLNYPSKGHILARQKNNQVSILAGTAIVLVPVKGNNVLESNNFIIGTEVGAVQRCNIQKPLDKDIRDMLQHN